jgi:hypothetical protein
MDGASGNTPARRVVVASLKESHSDRIIVGDRVLFLRNGTTCTYVVGTHLEVVFTVQDGRSLAHKITPVKQGS